MASRSDQETADVYLLAPVAFYLGRRDRSVQLGTLWQPREGQQIQGGVFPLRSVLYGSAD